MARYSFSKQTLQFLTDYTSEELLQTGLEIYFASAVGLIDEGDTNEGVYFEYLIQNKPGDIQYLRTDVYIDANGGLDTDCQCPNLPCEHEVAVILHLVSTGRLNLVDHDQSMQAPIPTWRKTLDSVLPPVVKTEETTEDVCLFFTEESGTVRIRPGERGKRGWIKGRVKWESLYSLHCSSRVRRLFQGLYDIWLSQHSTIRFGYQWSPSYGMEWLSLGELPTSDIWEILSQLEQAGVALVAWEGRYAVELSEEPARFRLAAREEDDDGALSLLPELHYGDSAVLPQDGVVHIFLGKPAALVAEVWQISTKAQGIRLRQFVDPVSEQLLHLYRRQEPLQVEQEDRADFEEQYLPRLQQLMPVESPDGSYQPPAPQEAVLNLEVTPVIGESDELVRLHLRWSWDRGPLGTVDREHESGVTAAVKNTGAEVIDQTLPRQQAVPFLANTLAQIEELNHVRVTVTAEVPEFRQAASAPQVNVGVSSGEQDWFDLQVEVTVGGENVSFAELFTALSTQQEIFVLPSGTYFDLDTPELDRLRRIIEEAKTLNDTTVENLKVSRYQVDLWEELVETGIVDAQEHDWWNKIRTLSDAADQAGDAAIQVPASVQADLRDYQKSGYRWLETLRRNELGGVLADDMGLGKTLQVIAMISAAFEAEPESDPFLVIAPTSVVGNWVREIEKFAPGLKAVSIEGTEKKRGTSLTDVAAAAQVLVTSYTLFRLESEAYGALGWSAAIFDEAQMIKNHTSKAYKSARLLDVPVKIAVTGTPMENNLMELWALVSLTSPGLLGGKTHFTEFYRSPIEKEQDAERLDLLQRRLRPFLLRRTKELVAADLPAKTENVMELDLYPKHRKIYDRRLQRERQKVLGLVDDLNTNRFEVFRSLTLLRQLALDTELATEDAAPSAKLDYLSELLASAATEGHRVLVLSQFTRFLSKAREAATEAGVDSLYLDGKTTGRQKLIDKFRDGETPVFFISLKAGGFGLNLTEADYVVLLDPWWNPATEAQAVDRAHRIGQTRQVMVYRLVARDTIESKVMELKKSKAALFDRVLEGGGTVEADGLGAADIKALLE